MPFQSEKQRRYLWANEPKIARDWTDTYGSGIAKALGGRIGLASGYKAALEKKSDQELRQWIDDQLNSTGSGDTQAEAILKERGIETTIKDRKATYDYSGAKVKKAGEEYSDIFGGMYETDEDKQQAQDFMKRLSGLKHGKKLHELSAGKELLEEMQTDRDAFKEKYGIDDYEMLNEAIGAGYDEARLSNEDWLKEADARQLMASSGMFGTDATYVDKITPQTRGPMGDEMWATPREGISSVRQPHGWDYGNQWQTAETEDENQWKMPNWDTVSKWGSGIYSALKGTMPWTLGAQALNFMGGKNRGPVINPSTQRFMQNYNVGRNPQTGRMIGGPFAGRNLPGTSMFGSKNPKEMAQNWMKKYGDMQYQTRKQQLKQQQIKNIATMNQGPAGITPKAPTGPVHSGQPTGGHHEGGGGGIGSTASRQGPAGGSVGASRFRSRGGRLYNTGGLAGLWPR